MNPPSPNLFTSLLELHPSDRPRPKENFLTEAFAYILRNDDDALNMWLSKLLGKTIKAATCEIKTRRTETDLETETSIFPDLLIVGQISDGEKFAVYCEHKWGTPCDAEQLRRYGAVAKRKHARLVFVGANYKQKSVAARCLKGESQTCFLWEDVFQALDLIPNKSPILKEFLDFMNTQGLSPGQPLSVERMRGFLDATDFLKSLENLAHKLWTNYSWDVVPSRFHSKESVRDRWGRVGIRFETKAWKPAITVGSLYDEEDHRVTLVNRKKGIDLLLRIEADPADTKRIQPVLEVLADKRKQLRKTAASVLLKDEPGNGNNYSVLIVRDCLADVIGNEKAESAQLMAIYKRLTTWLEILFNNGELEAAFRKTSLDSGMKK